MEFLYFVFSDFWRFLGFLVLLSAVGGFFYKCWNRFLRHRSLLRLGYPPPHCDADGEFREDGEHCDTEGTV